MAFHKSSSISLLTHLLTVYKSWNVWVAREIQNSQYSSCSSGEKHSAKSGHGDKKKKKKISTEFQNLTTCVMC